MEVECLSIRGPFGPCQGRNISVQHRNAGVHKRIVLHT